MKLVVGLGNPGEKYANTLHNVGFQSIDAFASEKGWGVPSQKKSSEFWKNSLKTHQVILLKPLTYMNLSGQAVSKFLQYYKISDDDTLVISDDIDLAPGKIRYRLSGSHGGHNGLRNIIQHIGSNFKRLRIGVGRPNDKENVSGYVLSAGKSMDELQVAVRESVTYIEEFIETGNVCVSSS